MENENLNILQLKKDRLQKSIPESIKLIFLAISLTLCFIDFSIGQGTLLDLKRNSDKLQISDIRYLEDPDGILKLEEVLKPEKLDEFKIFQGEKTTIGNNEEFYWLTFSVINQSKYDEEWIFEFGRFWSLVEV